MVIAIDMRSAIDARGGIPSYTRDIVRHILALPSNHTFVLYSNSYKFRAIDVHNKGERVHVVDLKMPNKLLSCSLSIFRRPYLDKVVEKRIGKKIDVWFSPNLNFTAVSPDCAFVLTAHDLSFTFFPDFFSHKMRVWHTTVAPRKLFRKATHVIAVSHHTRTDLISLYGVSGQNVSVVYHGVNVDSKNDIRHTIQDLKLPPRYILMAGADSKRKNLKNLVEAFYQVKRECTDLADLKLIITGLWRRPSPDISYMGFVSRNNYLTLLRNASALVYPSFYEGFGLPLLEAFSLGTPVIASAHSSLSEIGDDAFYPIDPYNTQSFASGIMEVMRDPRLREYFIYQGKRKAEKFSWDLAARQTLRILENCDRI